MYRRSYYRGRGGKYSNETMCINVNVTQPKEAGNPITSAPLVIVPATEVLGNRKVKNFTIKFTSFLCDDPIIGVLAYVPEGTNMTLPIVSGSVQSLYEPNQNVIASFVIPSSCVRNAQGEVGQASSPSTINISNRLARNLNTGDSIQLTLLTPNGLSASELAPANITGTINYSIKY